MLPDHCPEPSMATPLRDSPGSPTRTRLRLLSGGEVCVRRRQLPSSSTANHGTDRGIGLLILRHLIWSCLLLPHETEGGKVGPFLPEQEKNRGGVGVRWEAPRSGLPLVPGATRSYEAHALATAQDWQWEKQGEDVGWGVRGLALQKFQPLATRARQRRENEEGPQRPEAGAHSALIPPHGRKVKSCRPEPKWEELSVWFWWKLIELARRSRGSLDFLFKKKKANPTKCWGFLANLVKIL